VADEPESGERSFGLDPKPGPAVADRARSDNGIELTAGALKQDPGLQHLQPWVEDSGEGRWTVEESINTAVPAPVIALSLMMRFRSRQENSFGARMLAAMRQQFGGHAVKPK